MVHPNMTRHMDSVLGSNAHTDKHVASIHMVVVVVVVVVCVDTLPLHSHMACHPNIDIGMLPLPGNYLQLQRMDGNSSDGGMSGLSIDLSGGGGGAYDWTTTSRY